MENMISDLKNICILLGLDSGEHGLKDCDLAHSYLNRIIIMLGGK